MSEACTHDCSNCHADCSSRAPQHEPPHAKSHIKKVIGVVSGKGGVGKSKSCISWGGWEISMSMRQFCILPSKKHRSARQSWHFWR